jgi:uncharacterized protein (TIGR02444 family)
MRQSLWAFSLGFYGLPGVAAACLRCQDEADADVNLLLLLLWKAGSGIRVAQPDIESLDTLVRDWREHVVKPLRQLRRRLKTVDGDLFAEAASLREMIKAAELEAERQEQEALSRHALSVAHEQTSSADEAARANVAAYEAVIGRTLPADAVGVLLTALASLPGGYRTNS